MNAGFPDFLLLSSASRGQAAIAEVKTWWSYSQAELGRIFDPIIVHEGRFNPDSNTTSAKLLKQVSIFLSYEFTYLQHFIAMGPNALL